VYNYNTKPGDAVIQTWYDEAIFQDEDGIKEYYIARRLVKKFEIGDHVTLDVVGCCTVLGVKDARED
jgi:hypothetical protein